MSFDCETMSNGEWEALWRAVRNNPERYIYDDVTRKIFFSIFGRGEEALDIKISGRTSVVYNFFELAAKQLMEGRKIGTALEIGTFNGLPSAVMSQYAKKVITIDVLDNQEKYRVWDFVGAKNIEFFLVNNEVQKEKLIKSLKFDFCYMDGAHASCTYSDWMMVRKCGAVLFHEYWSKQPPVKELVDSLPPGEVDKNFEYFGYRMPFAFWRKEKSFAFWRKGART